jgi:hypothetical protein
MCRGDRFTRFRGQVHGRFTDWVRAAGSGNRSRRDTKGQDQRACLGDWLMRQVQGIGFLIVKTGLGEIGVKGQEEETGVRNS